MNQAIGTGLIGTGFMGRAHAIALGAVGSVFADITPPRRIRLADSSPEHARRAADDLGYERHGGDWRAVIDDPDIQAVSICTPNWLHYEMALAALEAGKHVWCEKPLAVTVEEAQSLTRAAQASGKVHLVGFNYAVNPLVRTARDLIAAGEIGTPTHVSGRYFEDYMSDPAVPHSWRCVRQLAGSGALADLGSHLVNLVHVLLGPVTRVNATTRTLITERREPASGELLPVENEDVASLLAEVNDGVPATLDISRVATGYKCGLIVEVFGTRGALRFDQERMNELQLYSTSDPAGRNGFRVIQISPAHPDFSSFCPAPGHGLGYNDLKVIEARNFLRAVQSGEGAEPDFTEGLRVQQVMDAAERSAAEGSWVSTGIGASP